MLKRLYDWRVTCSPQQLLNFEAELTPVCKQAIGQKTLHERYNDRYHAALLNQKTLLAAVQIRDPDDVFHIDCMHGTAGEIFACKLANLGGSMAFEDLDAQDKSTFLTLKKRGIVWLHDHHIYMPADFVLMLRGKRQDHDWMSLCAALPNIMLQQIIMPDSIGFVARKPPLHHEMTAALLCQGLQSLASVSPRTILDEKDWDLLCYLDTQGAIDSVKRLQRFCPDAIDAKQIHARLPSQSYSSGRKNKSALESALEEHFPKRLKKLLLLGLVGLIIKNHNESSTQVVLSKEASVLLLSYWDDARERIVTQKQNTWNALHCEVGIASPWTHEHDLWRIWLALHFLPVRRTMQGTFFKTDLNKLAKLLHLDRAFPLNKAMTCLLRSGFLNATDARVFPVKINWVAWAKQQFNRIINWTTVEAEQRMAAQLLLELPVNQWLKLRCVIPWLQARSKSHGILSNAPWGTLFTRVSDTVLHHVDATGHCIYLPPVFHAVLSGAVAQTGQAPFASPGWKGAEPSATGAGFINAAGDIQLPPEFSHKTLQALTPFCALESVEHQITLHINGKEISRLTRSQSQIEAFKALLESIQTPLPQAVAYLFNKQVKMQPVARIESASLLIMLRNPADAQRIQALGFPVRQPFSELPQLMLLEDGIYAQGFVAACLKAGILLNMGISPKYWIEGTNAIYEWMHARKGKTGDWLEVCYQQRHNGAPTQKTVRLESAINCLNVRKLENKTRHPVLSPRITLIEHLLIFRLRKLTITEIKQYGLDKLS